MSSTLWKVQPLTTWSLLICKPKINTNVGIWLRFNCFVVSHWNYGQVICFLVQPKPGHNFCACVRPSYITTSACLLDRIQWILALAMSRQHLNEYLANQQFPGRPVSRPGRYSSPGGSYTTIQTLQGSTDPIFHILDLVLGIYVWYPWCYFFRSKFINFITKK